MTKSLLTGAIASTFALLAMPANAADWGEKMQLCADAAAQTQGIASDAEYDVKFVDGSARRLTIEIVPAAGGDPVVAECKISRGKIKDVELQA